MVSISGKLTAVLIFVAAALLAISQTEAGHYGGYGHGGGGGGGGGYGGWGWHGGN